jgi:ketosteroid isomerase-like protein
MTGALIATAYLNALENEDVAAVLALFQPEAIVHSPLYGRVPARQFYPALFTDTGRARLHLYGVAEGDHLAAIWFRFDWTLRSGRSAGFDCVDMLTLDRDGLISALHIIYDTVTVRPAFERETGHSWRPGQLPRSPR